MFGEGKYPDFPTLKQHRHNQSIFSLLVCKYGFPYLNRTKNVWGEFVIPELDGIQSEHPIDNSYRREEDSKDNK
jgi:hypothetical protein